MVCGYRVALARLPLVKSGLASLSVPTSALLAVKHAAQPKMFLKICEAVAERDFTPIPYTVDFFFRRGRLACLLDWASVLDVREKGRI